MSRGELGRVPSQVCPSLCVCPSFPGVLRSCRPFLFSFSTTPKDIDPACGRAGERRPSWGPGASRGSRVGRRPSGSLSFLHAPGGSSRFAAPRGALGVWAGLRS